MLLRINNLGIARGGVPLLANVSFSCDAGEVILLRGPNGIGKTTLLRTMSGLQGALSGTVEIDTETFAYASHADGVKSQLSVMENLRFWADVYGTEVNETVLSNFDLEELRDRLAGTLSAGQKRRLGLARLGVIRRKILFLDEPTVSLDAASVRLFADWLRGTHLASGGCAVIATHIDLGFDAPELDLSQFIAKRSALDASDEVFL